MMDGAPGGNHDQVSAALPPRGRGRPRKTEAGASPKPDSLGVQEYLAVKGPIPREQLRDHETVRRLLTVGREVLQRNKHGLSVPQLESRLRAIDAVAWSFAEEPLTPRTNDAMRIIAEWFAKPETNISGVLRERIAQAITKEGPNMRRELDTLYNAEDIEALIELDREALRNKSVSAAGLEIISEAGEAALSAHGSVPADPKEAKQFAPALDAIIDHALHGARLLNVEHPQEAEQITAWLEAQRLSPADLALAKGTFAAYLRLKNDMLRVGVSGYGDTSPEGQATWRHTVKRLAKAGSPAQRAAAKRLIAEVKNHSTFFPKITPDILQSKTPMDSERGGFNPQEAAQNPEDEITLTEGRDADAAPEANQDEGIVFEAAEEGPRPAPEADVKIFVEFVKEGEVPPELGLEDLEDGGEVTVDAEGLVHATSASGKEMTWTQGFAKKLAEGSRLAKVAETVVATFADRMDGNARARLQAARELAQQISWAMPDRKQATAAIKAAGEYLARASKTDAADFYRDVTLSGWSKRFLDRAQEGVQKLFRGKKYTEDREALLKGLEESGYMVEDVTDALEEIDDGLESGNITSAAEVLKDISDQLAQEKPTYRVVENRELVAFVHQKLDRYNAHAVIDLTDAPEAEALNADLKAGTIDQLRDVAQQKRAVAQEIRRRQTEAVQKTEDNDRRATRAEYKAAVGTKEVLPDMEDDETPTIIEATGEDESENHEKSNDIVFEDLEDTEITLEDDDTMSDMKEIVAQAAHAKQGTALARMAEFNPEVYAKQLAFITQDAPKKPGLLLRFLGRDKAYSTAMELRKQAEEYVDYWKDMAARAQHELSPKSSHELSPESSSAASPRRGRRGVSYSMDRYGGFRGAEATRSGRSSAEWDSEAMKAIAEEEEANADMLTPAENMTQKEIDEAFGSIRSRGSVGRDRFGAAKIYRRSGKATSYDYAPDAANAQQPTLNAKRGTSKVVQGVPVRQESGPTKKKAA